MMLQVELPASRQNSQPQTMLALNDVVISKSAWGHMVTLGITIDEQVVTDIAADALIISTPTGSSAYNYAAGGPVLYPDMDAFILNALCAHRMRASPLVVPGEARINVTLRQRRPGDSAQVLTDGQPWHFIADKETLKISMAPMYLPLMVFENDFFGKLRNKLRWGGLF
jgi:NAD+ kinase